MRTMEPYLCDPSFVSLVRCGTAADFSEIAEESIDYIFTDPPYGANMFYADCNILWES